MDIVYAASEVTAADVMKAMPEPPSYSTVRKLMAILVEKGCLKHREQDGKYYYQPTKPRAKAGKSAMTRVLETFYEGSLEKAVAAFLNGREAKVSNEELDRLAKLIDDAKSEGR
jgi:predicted transcriptional regulator